jgi:hypothetical protein
VCRRASSEAHQKCSRSYAVDLAKTGKKGGLSQRSAHQIRLRSLAGSSGRQYAISQGMDAGEARYNIIDRKEPSSYSDMKRSMDPGLAQEVEVGRIRDEAGRSRTMRDLKQRQARAMYEMDNVTNRLAWWRTRVIDQASPVGTRRERKRSISEGTKQRSGCRKEKTNRPISSIIRLRRYGMSDHDKGKSNDKQNQLQNERGTEQGCRKKSHALS